MLTEPIIIKLDFDTLNDDEKEELIEFIDTMPNILKKMSDKQKKDIGKIIRNKWHNSFNNCINIMEKSS